MCLLADRSAVYAQSTRGFFSPLLALGNLQWPTFQVTMALPPPSTVTTRLTMGNTSTRANMRASSITIKQRTTSPLVRLHWVC